MIFFSPFFEDDVQTVWDYEHSVEQYQATGGTSRASVQEQIQQLKEWLNSQKIQQAEAPASNSV